MNISSNGINTPNISFDISTTGWATYKDTAAPIPTIGTGGTSTLSLTRNTTNPLIGIGEGVITKPASNVLGEGISYDFSINRGIAATPLKISFVYETSANYSDGYISIFLFDKTNNILIPLSVQDVPNSYGKPGNFLAIFNPSNATQYRLIFHITTNTTTAWTFRLDSVEISQRYSPSFLQDAPVGQITEFGGSVAPKDWFICDGSTKSRIAESDLFAVIGTSYGAGDGSTTFNLPDFREAAPVGSGTRGSGAAAHDTFIVGQFKDDQKETHTHSISTGQGSHGHGITDPGHSHGIADPGHTHGIPIPYGRTNYNGVNQDYASGLAGTLAPLTINGANTGITINGSSSGVSINGNTLPAMTADGTGSGRVGTVTRGKRLGTNFIIKARKSSNVNLASDFQEFASNDGSGGTAAGGIYTTGVKYGPEGSAFVAINSTSVGETTYRISFQRPIQNNDAFFLEIKAPNCNWEPIPISRHVCGRVLHNSVYYGAALLSGTVGATDTHVVFGNGGRLPATTYGGTGSLLWSDLSNGGYRWRVRKISNGNMAEQISYPVGTIWMFDANKPSGSFCGASGAWIDNQTIPGWFAMIAENSAYGCTDMTNRFMMGKVIAGVGTTSGSNSVTLAVENLPIHSHTIAHTHTMAHTHTLSHNHTMAHTHTISHGHTNSCSGQNRDHVHGQYVSANPGSGGSGVRIDYTADSSGASAYPQGIYTGGSSQSHEHSITINDFSGSSEGASTYTTSEASGTTTSAASTSTTSGASASNSGNAGSGTAINTTPSNYSIIYIRKCL